MYTLQYASSWYSQPKCPEKWTWGWSLISLMSWLCENSAPKLPGPRRRCHVCSILHPFSFQASGSFYILYCYSGWSGNVREGCNVWYGRQACGEHGVTLWLFDCRAVTLWLAQLSSHHPHHCLYINTTQTIVQSYLLDSIPCKKINKVNLLESPAGTEKHFRDIKPVRF